MGFISENFLLRTKTARRLYEEYAADQAILDYHCHLPAKDIADNHRFRDLTEIWLEGDHYKWRAMRANGVPERYCTGNAEPFEKISRLRTHFRAEEMLRDRQAARRKLGRDRLMDKCVTFSGLFSPSKQFL
jgi:glucuronate isomerase